MRKTVAFFVRPIYELVKLLENQSKNHPNGWFCYVLEKQ